MARNGKLMYNQGRLIIYRIFENNQIIKRFMVSRTWQWHEQCDITPQYTMVFDGHTGR